MTVFTDTVIASRRSGDSTIYVVKWWLFVILGILCLRASASASDDGMLTRDQALVVISHAFPAEVVREAMDVAYCESRYDAKAVGKIGELGLFQIYPPSWNAYLAMRMGGVPNLKDPWANAAAARLIWEYDGGRFSGQWVYCGG